MYSFVSSAAETTEEPQPEQPSVVAAQVPEPTVIQTEQALDILAAGPANNTGGGLGRDLDLQGNLGGLSVSIPFPFFSEITIC